MKKFIITYIGILFLTSCQKEPFNIAHLQIDVSNAGSRKNTTGEFKYGSLKDIDGNKYKTIQIGNQIWMAENLKVTKYRNGDVIPNITSGSEWTNLTTGAWSFYKNDIVIGKYYGKLYNWYAVNDVRGLAPKGWHVASDDDWNILATYLEGNNLAGGHLKSVGIYETGTGLWLSPNLGATNDSGFEGLPGGNRQWTGGDGNNINAISYWWTSTGFDEANAFCRSLSYASEQLFVNYNPKKDGNYIRCVKD